MIAMWHPLARVRLLFHPMVVFVRLEPQNGSAASGLARLFFVAPRTLRVRLRVTGLRPFSRHPAHIHLGSCRTGGPILFPLNALVAGRFGNAGSVTDIGGVAAIPRTGWFVNVHRGPTLAGAGATPIACGDVRPGRVVTFGGSEPDEADLRDPTPETEDPPAG
jgi:hypothetical protein